MSIRRYVIMLSLTLGVIAGTFAWTLAGEDRPVLGLDLQGGISIVLFPVEGTDTSGLDTAVDIIRNRVDALGIAEPEVQRQGDTIVVDLPGVKDREQAEQLVGQTAELRFRVVQGTLPWDEPIPTTTTVDPADEPPRRPERDDHGAAGRGDHHDRRRRVARRAGDPDRADLGRAPGADAGNDRRAAPRAAVPTPVGAGEPTTTVPAAPVQPEPGQTCSDLVATRDENTPEASIWLPGRPGDNGQPEVCYLLGPALMTGRNIDSAGSEYDPNTAEYVTNIEFGNDEFVEKVAPLVGSNVAIELDGVVQSAPTINPGITGRDVQISGGFGQGEADDLALVLRYGSLPVQFDPDEQTVQSISPSLGKDQLHAGIVAGLIGLSLVALYMLVYYRLLGMVVVLGLGLTGDVVLHAHDMALDESRAHTDARRCDRSDRVGRCHRRLVRRVFRAAERRDSYRQDRALIARLGLQARVPHDRRGRPGVVARRGRSSTGWLRAVCAASRSSSASRRSSTSCSRTSTCTRSSRSWRCDRAWSA